MSVVSDLRIAQAAQKAGFPVGEIATAVAVALAESDGDPNQTHLNDDVHRSTDYGLWQINGYWWRDLFVHYTPWSDPDVNAQMALQVFNDSGRTWTPWNTYMGPRYFRFLDRGRAAAAALNNPNPDGPAFGRLLYLRRPWRITGSDVTALQRLVKATPDGDFGPLTDKALRVAQKLHGVDVDGCLGPVTARALGGRWIGK